MARHRVAAGWWPVNGSVSEARPIPAAHSAIAVGPTAETVLGRARAPMSETPVGHGIAVRVVTGVIEQNRIRQPTQSPSQQTPRHCGEGPNRDARTKMQRCSNNGAQHPNQREPGVWGHWLTINSPRIISRHIHDLGVYWDELNVSANVVYGLLWRRLQ